MAFTSQLMLLAVVLLSLVTAAGSSNGGGGSEDEPSSRFQLLARAAPRPVAVGGAVVSVVVSEELSGCGERRLRGEATAPPPLPDRRGSKGCITYESWLAVLPG